MPRESDDLLKKLNSLPTAIRKTYLSKALRITGNIVRDRIIQNAPEQLDTPHGALAKGELKENITTRVHVAKDENAASDTDYVEAGPNSKVKFVARFLEDGHVARPRTKRAGPQKFVQPHPFVRRSVDATKDAATQAFADTLAESIKGHFNG